jgi:hypothetical protein
MCRTAVGLWAGSAITWLNEMATGGVLSMMVVLSRTASGLLVSGPVAQR